MKLSEFKNHIKNSDQVTFELWNWESVPSHYHFTEIGIVLKKFIDCGGQVRYEEKISLQLRTADDTNHRLQWEKILSIIEAFEKNISSKDADVEVEYQWVTIWKYWLEVRDNKFILIPTMTDCLAKDACGIPQQKEESCCGWWWCC